MRTKLPPQRHVVRLGAGCRIWRTQQGDDRGACDRRERTSSSTRFSKSILNALEVAQALGEVGVTRSVSPQHWTVVSDAFCDRRGHVFRLCLCGLSWRPSPENSPRGYQSFRLGENGSLLETLDEFRLRICGPREGIRAVFIALEKSGSVFRSRSRRKSSRKSTLS